VKSFVLFLLVKSRGGGGDQFKDSCSHGESLHRLFEREFEVIEHSAEVES
jgi:hypothetical protein